MSPARRAAAAVTGVVLLVAGGLLLWRAVRDDESDVETRAVVMDVREAGRPFPSLTAGTIRVGQRDLEVVIADEVDERIQGLRERSDAAPYAGMLFVFDGDSTGPFTMASVLDALDIAFFAADGRRVDQLRMVPCRGTDATCPAYESSAPYRYALETAAGAMPDGRLRVR